MITPFFYIFQWMITTLATNQNSLEKNTELSCLSVLARRTLRGLKSALSTRNGDRLDHSGPVGRFSLECSFLRKCSRVCFSHSCSHTTTDGREREREDVKKGSATSTGGELCGLRSRTQVQTDRQTEEERRRKWVQMGLLWILSMGSFGRFEEKSRVTEPNPVE
jgi:hypothetical protein